MDYNKHIQEMILTVDGGTTPEQLTEMTVALVRGLVSLTVLAGDSQNLVEQICRDLPAMALEAKASFEIFRISRPMDKTSDIG